MRRRDALRRIGSLAGIGTLALLPGRLTSVEADPDPASDDGASGDAGSATDAASETSPSFADESGTAVDPSFADEPGTETDFMPAIASPEEVTGDGDPSREAVAEQVRETHASRCRCPICGGGSMPGRP